MYQNDYNQSIAAKVRQNAKKQIQRQVDAATMGDPSFTSNLESMALKDSRTRAGLATRKRPSAIWASLMKRPTERSVAESQLPRRKGDASQSQRQWVELSSASPRSLPILEAIHWYRRC